ncbi:hypothetical protein J3R30DRAFT_3429819 [Lentinula aciculospora]|uniref:Cupin type-2 domain-containing protein n=1 Tax=Lentinula aciculospora TaxID=153920 RepID=A0A9W9APJ2_9AGAR|nr:hypothetical protein J3R30DRAFT_3333558 [Lentinula aciculospora]KAJ4487629.1 hypothetical protein J3R30DRAFT_3429819 [Lentinula aciculospora]
MPEYSDRFEIAKGATLILEPQLRILEIRGDIDDDLFQVPLHWHEDHDEIMTILSGKLKITLGKETKVYTPESGDVFVRRGIPHAVESLKGIPCVSTERTNPSEMDKKEIFFRNLLSIPGGLPSGSLVPMMQVFYYGDGYPAFPIHVAWLEKAFVKILGGYVAPLLGHQLKYKSLKKEM